MTGDEGDPKEEQFTSLMAACDDALAAGKTPHELAAPSTPSELQQRLQRNLACVELVRQALRPSAAPPAPNDSTLSLRAAGDTGLARQLPWTSLGRFQILRELGRGGFGMVFLAYDPHLGRHVALKVPHAEVVLTPDLKDRFQREARAAAGLEHPNLVPVYEAGQVGPVCYIISAYCAGITLTRWLRQNTEPVGFSQAAQFIATLADAVQHAHSRGVVHRDLKPSNVLLQIADCRLKIEEPIEQTMPGTSALHPKSAICNLQSTIPKITDFGLAKHLSDEAAEAPEFQTRTGAIVGTPSYMAPEQASGKKGSIGPATDVYALGAILYELLTRRPPFQGDSELETLLHVQADEPVPPSRLRPRVPRDLETVCLKCLQKEPAKRYAGAGELAEDLRRWLARKPILARPVGTLERLGRWSRRNPGLSTMAASVLLLALLLLVGSVWAALRFEADNERLLQAERDTKKQLFWSYVAQVQAGRRSGLPGQRLQSLETLAEAVRVRRELKDLEDPATTRMLRNEMIRCLVLADLKVGREWPGYPEGSTSITFDARLALYARAHTDGTVRVARVERDEEMALLKGRPGRDVTLLFSPDGRFLAALSDGELQIWDLEKQSPTLVDLGQISATALDFHPKGHQFASGHPDGTISLYDLDTRRRKQHWQIGALDRIAFRPDGREIAVMRRAGSSVEIWSVEHEKQVTPPLSHPGVLTHMAWSKDGKRLAVSCDQDRRIHVWDMTRFQRSLVLEGHSGWTIYEVVFHPAEDLLASSGNDGTIRLWDLASGQQLFRMTAGTSATNLRSLRFSADGQWLSGKIQGRDVGFWQVATGHEYRTIARSLEPEPGIGWGTGAISRDGKWVAMAMQDGAHIWELATGKEVAQLAGGITNAVLFTPGGKEPEGKEVLTFGVQEPCAGLYRWPIRAPGDSPGRLQIGPPDKILAERGERLSISQDGRFLAVPIRFRGGVVLKLDPPLTRGPPLEHAGVLDMAISPDGRWAATGSGPTRDTRELKVWDLQTGESEELPTEEGSGTVSFSPDSQWLVTGLKHTYRFWQVPRPEARKGQRPTWKPGLVVPRSGDGFIAIAFSADGKMVALETAPAHVQLLDPVSGEEFATLEDPHMHRPGWMAFTPDSTQLVIASETALHVWNVRLLRAELTEFGLDWDLPGYEESPHDGYAVPREIKVEPSADSYYMRGVSHRRRNKLNLAIADFQEALNRDPNEARTCNELAWIYATGPLEIRNPAKALQLAQRAVDRQQDSPIYLNTLGVACYRVGLWENAVATLKAAGKANGSVGLTPFDQFFLAMSYHRLGKLSEARKYYDAAVAAMQHAKPNEMEELNAFRTEANAVLH